ncbi:MAG: hypothetical protein SCH72_12445 [Desulfuromonadales bacterium]|nr:hypothetical protein [Desulfuromonadales bacterium]
MANPKLNIGKKSIEPESSKRSPKKKEDSSSDSLRLTPSEIESLRKHGKQVSAQLRGRFKDLLGK